jgi:hypothetical protein
MVEAHKTQMSSIGCESNFQPNLTIAIQPESVCEIRESERGGRTPGEAGESNGMHS